jgi:hypothetical protein
LIGRVLCQQGWGQLCSRANPFNAVVADEQAGVAQLGALARVGVIVCGDAVGVVDEQGGHGWLRMKGKGGEHGRWPGASGILHA